jgi:hypothetical protein
MLKPLKLTMICALAVAAHAQTTTNSQGDANVFSTKIGISISCNDPGLKNQVLSSFNSEIRRLGDVVIADIKEAPEYTLDIVAMTNHNRAGTETGYGMSVVVRRSIGRRLYPLAHSVKEHPTGEDGKTWTYSIMGLLMNGTEILDHHLIIGTPDELHNVARGIISDLDVKSLDSDRRDWVDAHKPNSPADPDSGR